MWRGCGRGRELVAALCTAALAVCRWPVVFFEGFLFTCRCCCRCLGEGFVCVSDRVMRRVMRHMKKVDGNAPLPLEPPPSLALPLKLPLASPLLPLPLSLPLSSVISLSLPLSLPLSSPLFSLPEEEQQHVGQIRALGGYARGCLVDASFAPFRLPLKSEPRLLSLPFRLPLRS